MSLQMYNVITGTEYGDNATTTGTNYGKQSTKLQKTCVTTNMSNVITGIEYGDNAFTIRRRQTQEYN